MKHALTIDFTQAEVNLVRQSLRAERDRMNKSGFTNLALVAQEALTKVENALIDKNVVRA